MESPRAAREARRPKTAAAAAVRRAAAGCVEMKGVGRGSDGTCVRFDRVDRKSSGLRRGDEKSADRAHLSDNGIRLGRETGRARVRGEGTSPPSVATGDDAWGVLDPSAHHGDGAASAGRALRAGLDDRRADPGAGGGGHGERHVMDGRARQDERGARGFDESRRGTATRCSRGGASLRARCSAPAQVVTRVDRGSRSRRSVPKLPTPPPNHEEGWKSCANPV